MTEGVMYRLPKSRSFSQAVRGDPRRAWTRLEQMLATQTHDLRVDDRISLYVDMNGEWRDAGAAGACLGEAHRLFGPGTEASPGYHTWQLGREQLDAAIGFALSDAWPRKELGAVNLLFSYSFRWRFFAGGYPESIPEALREDSGMIVNICRPTLWVLPTFVFPMPYGSAGFEELIAQLGAAAPFDIKPQYFRRMVCSPRTGSYRLARLA